MADKIKEFFFLNFKFNFFYINFLFLIVIIYASFLISNHFLPAEDAAILFRYSKNFSETGIISYNFETDPVEGATDFLWMLTLSFLKFIGFEIFFVAITINLLSLLIICNLLVKYFNLSKIYIILLFFLHLSLPVSWAALEGFSVLFFELFFVLVLIIFTKKKSPILFLYISFIGCLIRPDFILFCLVPSILIFLKERKNKKFIFHLILIISLGLLYIFWRYSYFKLLFPLPYYVKSTWLFLNNKEFLRLIAYLFPLYFFFIFYVNFSFLKICTKFFFIFILLPTIFYSSQTLYQNLGYRFYFYIIPYSLFLILFLIDEKKIKTKKVVIVVFITIINTLFLHFKFSDYRPFLFSKSSEIYILSKDLQKNFSNLKIATTEAGMIPYYSNQFTVDLWGLNTPIFAKNPAGGQYLIEEHFDIIILNSAEYGNDCNAIKKYIDEGSFLKPKKNVNRKEGWSGMIKNLFTGLDNSKYDFYIFEYVKHLNRNLFIMVNRFSNYYNNINVLLKKRNIQKCKI